MTNQLRKAFGFEGVPLRVSYKKRRRRGEEDAEERNPRGKKPAERGKKPRLKDRKAISLSRFA